LLVERHEDFSGAVGAWAGGIVHAVGHGLYGVPKVMNSELEAAFNAKMPAIRNRSKQVRYFLGDDMPLYRPYLDLLSSFMSHEFTLRDEANAMVAYAFRNGPIEDIHADGRITDDEMKRLMINACENMAKPLTMKRATPPEYDAFIRGYGRLYCGQWQR
jgi:hypothetical protein